MFGWFKNRKTTPSPGVGPEAKVEYISLQDDLMALMSGHGLDASTFDDWLIVDNELPALRGTYNIANTDSNKITTQVDIELRLSDGRSICEHYAGLGDDQRQASGQGLFKFCCGAFHVYLSAYWHHHEADQVEIETWEIGGVRWNAYISNMINQASAGAAACIPNDYLSTVQSAISALPLEAEDHWLSFYGANLKGDLTIDARLDNQDWQELSEQLATLDWPPTDGFYSTRNFILLRPARS